MNTIKALLILAVMLLISGCGTKVPFKAKEALDGAAVVYIYANDTVSDDDSMQNNKFQLRINNKNVAGRLNGGEYRVFDMKPDTILVSAVRTNIEEHYVKLSLEAGKVYYLRIQTGAYGEEFTFEEVSASEGQKEIVNTTLAGVTGIDTTAYVPDFAGSTAGKDGTLAVPALSEAEIDAIIEKKIADKIGKMKIPAPATAPVAQTPVVSKSSTMDEIDRAFEMKQKGIITQEEFNKIKAEILAK